MSYNRSAPLHDTAYNAVWGGMRDALLPESRRTYIRVRETRFRGLYSYRGKEVRI